MESEKLLEKKLADKVKKLGGLAIKLVCLHFVGLPDRLILMPGGVCFFVEVKTTKQKPRKIQLLVHKKLRGLGFEVYVVDSSEQITHILKDFNNVK